MERFFDIVKYRGLLDRMDTCRWTGHVAEMVGLIVESEGPAAAIGDFCEIHTRGAGTIRAQVTGFRNGRVMLVPLEEHTGLQAGDLVVSRPEDAKIMVGDFLLGRVLDGFGRPIDGRPLPGEGEPYDLYRSPPGPLERKPIGEALVTGIRAIDSLLTCGRGQRIGIFGGSGVGKSTLLGSMAKNHAADVCVIALVGERNREVREFIEHELGEEGLSRSVVVAATSDRPAPLRLRAAYVALAVAEYFCDQGKSVLLIMDSVTRLAMAQREIELATGEPPSQKGYTPSVFNMLPKIFERAGNFEKGSITGLFTVLVEGDDFNEPIADAVRGILDGHIVLSRQLGEQGHYPAIDILQSVSRLASKVAGDQQKADALKIREALATVRNSEDLINLGAYTAGGNPQLDHAVRLRPMLQTFLRQRPDEPADFTETLSLMRRIASQ
jgi:FliI/YscN family ATPase